MEAVHVLNGDALAYKFPVAGEVIVCREALIDGPVKAHSLDHFWKIRASYLSDPQQEKEESYLNDVKNEFEKLKKLKNVSSISLWFEHDLFCQVNMWFIINYLTQNEINFPVYRVMPPSEGDQKWLGFGPMAEAELQHCFDQKTQLSQADIALGSNLWKAYQSDDLSAFNNFSLFQSKTFPLLREVCEAHIQRFPEKGLGRPQSRLKQLTTSGITEFDKIFREFGKTEGIYGFGDIQVKKILEKL